MSLQLVATPSFRLSDPGHGAETIIREILSLPFFDGLQHEADFPERGARHTGHCSPLEVPDQVNAMIERLCTIAAGNDFQRELDQGGADYAR